jgi:hypothetical protein
VNLAWQGKTGEKDHAIDLKKNFSSEKRKKCATTVFS